VQVDASLNLTTTGSACGAGGGGTPGGSTTQVQYNNAGAFGGAAGVTFTGNTGQLNFALGTITTNVPAVNITGTFNNVATTFDAPLFMNITNTASASASKLLDLQVGGGSFLSANTDGSVTVNQQTAAITANAFTVVQQGTTIAQFQNTGINIVASPGALLFSNSGGSVNWGGGPILIQDSGSFTIAQRNSTNAQTFRVYNTFTDASNYERAVMDWTTTANLLTIGMQKAGTGSLRNIQMVSGGNFLFTGNTFNIGFLDSNQFGLGSGQSIAWAVGNVAGQVAGDTALQRGAAGVLQLYSKNTSADGATWSAVSNTPSTLASGSTNNYDPTVVSYFQRLTANAANSTLTGFAPNTAAQIDGQVHVIINVAAAGTLTLSHQDAGSTATNRFLCSTGANIVLSPNQAADVIYDTTVGRWLVFKRN
jgi:hypothetical protein